MPSAGHTQRTTSILALGQAIAHGEKAKGEARSCVVLARAHQPAALLDAKMRLTLCN